MMRWLLSGCLTVLFLCAACAACAEVSTAPQSFMLTGSLAKGEQEAVFYQDAPGSGTRSAFPKSGTCQILGVEGGYYLVRWGAQTGYIARGKLALSGADSGVTLTEALSDTLSIPDLIPRKSAESYLEWAGELRSPKPLDAVAGFLWDERQLQVELAFVYVPSAPTAVIDASAFRRMVPLASLAAGRKNLVLQGISGEEQIVLFRTVLSIRGRYQEPAHVTGQCQVSDTRVTDEYLETAWTPETKKELTVTIPAGTDAALMTLEWKTVPASFTVTLYGASDVLRTETCATGFFADSVALSDEVRRVVLTCDGGALSTLRIYPAAYAADAVQTWEPLPEKVDLLVFSAHQDDEFLFFGGTIPYYCAKGRTVGVVYMADCGRDRYREALDGLWAAGLRTHPVFLNWIDKDVGAMSVAMNLWKHTEPEPVMAVVRLLRQYKPEVVVTHDFDGEYGHMQHQLTAKLVAEAAELAADETVDPDSAAKWGVWQVKKVYIHLYPENQIHMDWDAPLYEDSPVSALFLAKEGYDRHRSQQVYYLVETTGVAYDNTLFGLYYTTVGPDVQQDDFFENVPAGE